MGIVDLRMELESESNYDELTEEEETESPTQNGSQSSNDHVTEIFKYCDLYHAAKTGKLGAFSRILDGVSAAENASPVEILHRWRPAGDSLLHIAAKFGKADIVTYIGEKDPSLVVYKNSHEETALHLAAKSRSVSTVSALVEMHKLAQASSSNEAEENNVFRAKNERGNTALHEALISGRESIAEYLIQEDPEVSCYRNKDGESALYLAAKVGSAKCVIMILGSSRDQGQINKLFGERSPIEAAVKGKHKDVLEAILTANPSLKDGKGRAPLHYAALLGYLEEVLYLLRKYPLSATERDDSGSLPIHLASINGHVDIIEVLLEDFPDAVDFLDSTGRNILHLAALNGRRNLVRYILNNPRLTRLINMKDKEGNAPLHLATTYGDPKIVFDFTRNRRVNGKLVNDKGYSALDFAESDMGIYNLSFCRHLILFVLEAAGIPRSVSRKAESRQPLKDTLSVEMYKERLNTFLVVSTLVATVTFAAGFTLPGGYNSSSKTDLGIATMLREKGFQVFIFCDTMAMHSSIIAAVGLFWAQLGDPLLMRNALTLTASLLGIALGMMSVAFTAGVFLAVSKLRWLSTAVFVMGIISLVYLLEIVIPVCIPFASRTRILRFVCYYPYYLMILRSSRRLKDQADQRNGHRQWAG